MLWNHVIKAERFVLWTQETISPKFIHSFEIVKHRKHLQPKKRNSPWCPHSHTVYVFSTHNRQGRNASIQCRNTAHLFFEKLNTQTKLPSPPNRFWMWWIWTPLILYHPLHPIFSQESSTSHKKRKTFPQPSKTTIFPPNWFLVTAVAMSLYTNIPNDDGIAAAIHYHGGIQTSPTYKLSISSYSLHIPQLHSQAQHFRFHRHTHIHQILGTSMGTSMDLFMGKEECNTILAFLHLIYFWKRFIDNIFCLPWFSHPAWNIDKIYVYNQSNNQIQLHLH